MRPRAKAAVAALVCFLATGPAPAEVRPSGMFTDHMVLQREMTVPIWGTASPGETVTVEFDSQRKTVNADATGRWLATLDPMPANAQPRTLTVSKDLKFTDVLVGEVWLASGQSNMEMPVGDKIRPTIYPGVEDFAAEVRAANHPQLRLLKVNRRDNAPLPLAEVPTDGWKACAPESAELFSAVAYFFGRHLVQSLDVPVGIIASACSGSSAEQWTSLEALERFPQFEQVVAFYRDPSTPKLSPKEYRQRAPRKPPSCLFNGGLAPVIPYAIRGAIWYQGEANAERAVEYRQILPNMIADWRRRWGEGDFPFIQVQLAGFGDVPKNPGDDTWAELREAQAFAATTVSNVHLATAIDIGMPRFIHPTNKQEVGRRLGLVAQAKVYGAAVAASGPVFKGIKLEGSRAVLAFDQLGGGLVSRNRLRPGHLSGFAAAGEDRVWHWADASIQGATVLVSCAEVSKPVAVRYAWSHNIVADFYNQAGLPALPFRTDDWPLSTANARYCYSKSMKDPGGPDQ